jgi:hypothetical protein
VYVDGYRTLNEDHLTFEIVNKRSNQRRVVVIFTSTVLREVNLTTRIIQLLRMLYWYLSSTGLMSMPRVGGGNRPRYVKCGSCDVATHDGVAC